MVFPIEVNWPALGFASLAAASGVRAAAIWLDASRVLVEPVWPKGADGQLIEPVDPQQQQAGWISGQLRAGEESARLNAKAAGWTAVSVGLSALSALTGAVTLHGAG
jgi:hypothetical protein